MMAPVSGERPFCSGTTLRGKPCRLRAKTGSWHCGVCLDGGSEQRYLVARAAGISWMVIHQSKRYDTTSDSLESFFEEHHIAVGLFIVSNPSAGEPLLRRLLEYAEAAGDSLVPQKVMQEVYCEFTPSQAAEQIRNFLLVQAAANPSCSEEFQRELLVRWRQRAASALAMNPRAAQSVLRIIADGTIPLTNSAEFYLVHHDSLQGDNAIPLIPWISRDLVLHIIEQNSMTQRLADAIWTCHPDPSIHKRLMIEHPGFIRESMLESIVVRNDEEVVQWNLQVVAAANPNASADICRRLAESHLAKFGRTDINASDSASHHSRAVLLEVAQHPNTPTEVLVSLATAALKQQQRFVHFSAVIAGHLACNPNTPLDTLTDLLRTQPQHQLRAFAEELKLAPVGVDALLSFGENEIMAYLAGNPTTPPEALHTLSRNPTLWVAEMLAANPNTPNSIISEIIKPPNGGDLFEGDVLFRASKNPETDTQNLDVIAEYRPSDFKDPVSYRAVQHHLAVHPNTSSETLALLAFSPLEWIRESATMQLKDRKRQT